jgi:LPS export ABC transporter protein LptC
VNINIFFLLIVSGLMMIFFLFKPLDIKEQNFKDVPLFDMSTFTLFEFNNKGLATLMQGTYAVRYSNRYKVSNIDYTDNSQEYIANIKADNGVYKGNIIDLSGNVVYLREDGLTFKSQEASYNKSTTVVQTNSDYVAYMGENRAVGTSLRYNNTTKKMESKNIIAHYQLKERKL